MFCVGNGANNIRGNISTIAVLANAYVDLGTWHGITPFVGAGVGFAQHWVSGVSDSGFATNTVTASAAPPPAVGFAVTNPTFGTAANSTKTNFAWALMAGLAYDVTPNYKVEFAYRYLNMGKFQTGLFNCAGGCPAPFSLEAKTLDSHDFKVGMRWHLGGPSYTPVPIAEPRVITKF